MTDQLHCPTGDLIICSRSPQDVNLDQYKSCRYPTPLWCFSNRINGATVDQDKVVSCVILSTAWCGQQAQPLLTNKTSWTVMQTAARCRLTPVTHSTHYKAHESFWISKMLHSPLFPAHNNLTFNLSWRGGKKKLSRHRTQRQDYRWSRNCRESRTNQISHMRQQKTEEKTHNVSPIKADVAMQNLHTLISFFQLFILIRKK